MDFLSNANFWTIVAIGVAALGLRRAIRADRRREWQEIEQRREAGEKRLADQIVRLGQEVRQELTRRIDRLENRVDENHREATAAIGELKAEVRALSTKIDERSAPLRFGGRDLPSVGQGVASSAGVREESTGYSSGEPKAGSEERQ